MWRGHAQALAMYGHVICSEWRARGYKDSLLPFFSAPLREERITVPAWLGHGDFHRAHRSNLIRKLPEYYGKLWPDVRADLRYIWPEAQ